VLGGSDDYFASVALAHEVHRANVRAFSHVGNFAVAQPGVSDCRLQGGRAWIIFITPSPAFTRRRLSVFGLSVCRRS